MSTGEHWALGPYGFNWVSRLDPLRDQAGDVALFMPQARYAKATTTKLNPYGDGEFCKFAIPRDLNVEGVYVISFGFHPLYVGECLSLSNRFNMGYGDISPKNCYAGGQQTNCRVNKLVLAEARAGRRLDLWFLGSANRRVLERDLIRRVRPPWNRSR